MVYDPNQPHVHGQPAQPVQPVQPVAPAAHVHDQPAYVEPGAAPASSAWTGYAAIKYVAIVVIVLAVIIALVWLVGRIF